MLHQALLGSGLRVCFDDRGAAAGGQLAPPAARHLRSSAVVVVLVSSHTREAYYEIEDVVMAVDQVRREGARLVPVRLQAGTELPYGTQALQALLRRRRDAPGYRNPGRRRTQSLRCRPVKATQVWCSRVPALPVVFAGRDVLLEQLRPAVSARGGAVLTQTIQ
ncbi:MAG: TIR domain-containing protein, partial [Actinomycetota bacterium]|nr:TIR domain-containing protein [Actinomycetota bacterium]